MKLQSSTRSYLVHCGSDQKDSQTPISLVGAYLASLLPLWRAKGKEGAERYDASSRASSL